MKALAILPFVSVACCSVPPRAAVPECREVMVEYGEKVKGLTGVRLPDGGIVLVAEVKPHTFKGLIISSPQVLHQMKKPEAEFTAAGQCEMGGVAWEVTEFSYFQVQGL